MPIQSLCVFCGSRPGARVEYAAQADALGRLLASRDVAMVYGGAGVGLMARLADSVLGAGGRAIGVIPRALVDRELAHPGLTELHIVDTLHERKALMASLSDGFVALPGGVGTLDELFEIITWSGLGLHDKPVALLDVAGFFAPLLALLDHMVAEGFVDADARRQIGHDGDPAGLLDWLAAADVRRPG